MHVKPIEAEQARPGATGPGLAADRKTAAPVSSDQPRYETDVVLRDGSNASPSSRSSGRSRRIAGAARPVVQGESAIPVLRDSLEHRR